MKPYSNLSLVLFNLSLFVLPNLLLGQATIPLNKQSLYEWEKLQYTSISNDGTRSTTQIKPNRGNPTVVFIENESGESTPFERTSSPKISANSNYGVFVRKLDYDTSYSYKLHDLNNKGAKKSKLIKDTLTVVVFSTDSMYYYPNYKSHQLAKDSSDFLVVSYEKKPVSVEDSKKKKKKKKNGKKDTTKPKKEELEPRLTLLNPITNREFHFPDVKEYKLSRKGNFLLLSTKTGKKLTDSVSVFVFNTETQLSQEVVKLAGEVKSFSFDYNEKQAAFLHNSDTTEQKIWQLYSLDLSADSITANNLTTDLLEVEDSTQRISPHYTPNFSKNGQKLFYEVQTKPDSVSDDTLLPADKPNVDVWSYADLRLQPQQLKELKRDEKKGLMRVLVNSEKIHSLESDKLNVSAYTDHKNGNQYLLSARENYQISYSWEFPWRRDYVLYDEKTESFDTLLKSQGHPVYLSPQGNFLVYYDGKTKNWFSISTDTKKQTNLTENLGLNFSQEHHDYPYEPFPVGYAGFGKNDEFVLLYSQRDIWKFILSDSTKPKNLTKEIGSDKNARVRLIKRPSEKDHVDLSDAHLYLTIDQEKFTEKLYKLENDSFKELFSGGNILTRIRLAKYNEDFIFAKESFKQSPMLMSVERGNSPKPILETNKQQANHLWGTVEQTKWTSPSGDTLNGLIYKPDFFDPTIQYPMIVYFYRRYSNRIHEYKRIVPSRSIINPAWYTSLGYVVFIPDVVFETAKPGQSAVNCVVSGTEHLIKQGYINENKIGIQGHSWGGYQTAFIITRSDQFAAAMAGAPVSNMTSAYGGIRWGSGLSRMFQYEKSQSRIGSTLWENRKAYIENSPIFYLDKINTPVLIHHNDEDGAVPWYQGIEMFVGMRRLGKPCWMLNYNGEPHNLKKWGPKVDLTLRMQQFFDHYLRDKPAPKWMKFGVNATEKGKNLGY